VQDIAVVSQGDAQVGLDIGDIDILVEVDHVLALWIHLHQHLVLTHGLDDLANIRTGLLQQLELLSQ